MHLQVNVRSEGEGRKKAVVVVEAENRKREDQGVRIKGPSDVISFWTQW